MWRVRPPRVELVIGADPHERSTAPTLAIGGALARCGVPARPPADAPPGQVTGTQLAEAYEKDRTARVGDRRDWPNKPDRRALVGRFLAVHTRWRRTRARSPRLLLLCLLRPLADVGLASQNRARVHQVVAGDAQAVVLEFIPAARRIAVDDTATSEHIPFRQVGDDILRIVRDALPLIEVD